MSVCPDCMNDVDAEPHYCPSDPYLAAREGLYDTMTHQHSPGPWHVYGGRCGPKSDRLMVCHGDGDTFSPIVAEVHYDDGRLPRNANATLIAAAPTLLDTCERVLECLERVATSDAFPESKAALRAAIALATQSAD